MGGSGRDGESSGIIRHTGPAHPKYSTTESRNRTFSDWPPALKQRPKELAEAGFFYIGLSDQVGSSTGLAVVGYRIQAAECLVYKESADNMTWVEPLGEVFLVRRRPSQLATR